MMSDWPLVTIDSIKADSKGSIAIGPFGSRMKSDCYVEDGVPVIRGTNLTGGPTFEGNFVYITEGKADTLSSSNVYKNDLVFPHRGSIGEVGIILDDERYVISSSLMKLTCDRERVNPKFLYYFFKSRIGRHELLKNASQVGTPGIGQPLTSLKSIEFRLPPLPIQDQIEEMLTSIDYKIEHNRQTNQTLEQIAQAIFKSWFVDFEPIKAKAQVRASIVQGKLPGSDQPLPKDFDVEAAIKLAAMCAISGKTEKHLKVSNEATLQQLKTTAALFPDALVESEIGEIPEGWVISPLGEFLDVLETGRRPKGGVSGITEGVPSVGAENIIRIGQYNFGKEKFVSSEFFEKITSGVVESEDVLLYKDGGKPGVFKPRVSMFGHGFPYEKFAINEHVFRLRSNKLGQPYLYLQISHENVLFDLRHKGGKAAIPGINQKDVRTVDILIPPANLLNDFNNSIHQIVVGILNNAKQSLTLSELRDALLPKLLSGGIELNHNMEVAENV